MNNQTYDKLKQGLIGCGFAVELYESNFLQWVEKYGDSIQSKKDFLWHNYNLILMEFATLYSHDPEFMYRQQRRVYCEMLSFLIEEGKKITVAMKGILHCDLQLTKLSGYNFNVKILATKCCDECDKINGQTFLLEDVIDKNILPYSKCKRKKGCFCQYTFELL
jgi:hypothetical protein